MGNGFIVYEDNKLVTLLHNGKSKNGKTGNTLSTYTLAKSLPPNEAVKTGDDQIVCLDCKHRPRVSGGLGTCYVNVAFAPPMMWHAWRRGSYERLDLRTKKHRKKLKGRTLRIGSYGDPAVTPVKVWKNLIKATEMRKWTGYTHQWTWAKHLQPYVMASVDTPQEALKARSLGWRTFRVALHGEELFDWEMGCLTDPTLDVPSTCLKCGLCCGHRGEESSEMKSIVVFIHGVSHKIKAYTKYRNMLDRKQFVPRLAIPKC